jgi:hypothetical protein
VEVVAGDERPGPGSGGEVPGQLATRVRGGDHVAATIEVHDRRLAVSGSRRGPQAVYGVGFFVGHVLGLGSHVFGVLARAVLAFDPGP